MRRMFAATVSAMFLASMLLTPCAFAASAHKSAATHRSAGEQRPAGMLEAMGNVRSERIRADVKYLSSDAMEGRGTGTRGGELAAAYIAAQFKEAGVEPAGDNGTYFQKVPMVGITTQPESTVAVTSAKQTIHLKLMDDIVLFNQDQHETVDIDAPVVFVGYGVTAPEFGWDDYAGADVKGKILLMFVNEPPSDDPKFFAG